MHHIDVNSPFFELSQSEIRRSDFVLVLMMAGVDENLHDMVHKQHEYDHASMQWGATFVPVLSWNPQHRCTDLDFAKVSMVVPDESDRVNNSRIDMEDSTQTASATSGDRSAEAQAWNIEGSDREVLLNQLHFESALSPSRAPTLSHGLDGTGTAAGRSEPESLNVDESEKTSDEPEEDGDDDGESKSERSTKTNSDSESVQVESGGPTHRVRFDRRSRSTIFQIPRLGHPTHNHEYRESSLDQPASVAQRRLRFRNHPLSRFSKGLYYRALETPWKRLFPWLVIVYFAVISVIALLLYISVRTYSMRYVVYIIAITARRHS